ncbi:MAG: HEPN domain-containing protein [Candidatus Eremiobacteraeota bacterium]|nr:HEPN domain-containing protein [Candidatus Eremiobacteraeota bacterium]MBC5801807.1 HEPN domain-containing protein [Candidatus Eremiobacteraeota bacterium]MBC5821020.1 HEPN domain-containing protein [Candidatus Eremiobacteraeota bacterium]
MQRDRKQVARYWLAASRQDLRIADNYQATEPNVACFHAQQGCEKALQALLVQVAGTSRAPTSPRNSSMNSAKPELRFQARCAPRQLGWIGTTRPRGTRCHA